VIFPKSGLTVGGEGLVTVIAKLKRAEIPAEGWTFALHCFCERSPRFRLSRRTERLATVEPRDVRLLAGTETSWRLSFALPAGLTPANVLGDPPVWWVLEIEGVGDGSACRRSLVAPVFAAPRPPAEPAAAGPLDSSTRGAAS
jgi:hypothetical protein